MKTSRTTLALAAFVAMVLAYGPTLGAAQSASFTVSQNGHSVGTASYKFTARAAGYDSESLVRVSMQGLNYELSKTERLSSANHLQHVLASGIVNGSAVNVIAKPDPTPNPAQFLLNISANGRASTTRLDGHHAAVFLPDFDPGALQTLLALNVTQNGRDLWAVIPKKAGSIEPVTIATDAPEQGTFDGKAIVVQHLTVTVAGGKMEIFAGPKNELLQAELPEEGFALVRTGFVLTPPKTAGAPPAQPAQQQGQQQYPAPGQQQPYPPQQPYPQAPQQYPQAPQQYPQAPQQD
jgi:hypothetical protein